MSLATAYYPIVSDLHARRKHRLLRTSFYRAAKLTTIVMVPVVLILIGIGYPLIYILYGEEFLPAFLPFGILALWGLVRPIAAISNAVSNGVGKPFLNTKANLLILAMAIVLCTLLVPKDRPFPLSLIPFDGINGAAFSISISFVTGMILQIHFARKAIGGYLPIRTWGKSVVAAGIATIVLLLAVENYLDLFLGAGVLIQVLMTVGLGLMGLAIYIIIIRLMKGLDKEDVKLIESMPLPMKGKFVFLVRLIAGSK
jgi:O-antigen/teichoic acid export membrane protein